jgi:hypothetical protein
MKFLALSFVLLCAPGALLDFAMKEWKTDRYLEVRDAYKWLFQATRGGEHMAPSEEMARDYLSGEWKTLAKQEPNEKIWQPLCEDESIGRLNLRYFRAEGGKMDDVLSAFLSGSQNFTQSTENFLAAWQELGARLKGLKRKRAGRLTFAAWQKVDEEMKAKNYPAIEHSERYERERHPAYRVLPAAEMKKLMSGLKRN